MRALLWVLYLVLTLGTAFFWTFVRPVATLDYVGIYVCGGASLAVLWILDRVDGR